jgi:hypothetical protein
MTLFIAALALLFTIASFWWINVRRGQLRTYRPVTYASSMTATKLVVCLPLVLHNNGAAPIVVLTMRLRFLEAPDAPAVPWQNKRDKLPPDNSAKSLAAGFAVAGRTAEQGYFEFSQDNPKFLPPPGTVRVVAEALLGHRKSFQRLAEFTLNMEKSSNQAPYLAYGNDPMYD